MKSAVIYARYSSASQTEQSIEGQLDVCQKYAQDNDLQIVDTYIDRAMTGKNDQRVAFQKLLSDSEKPVTWEIVLVYAIDRFGRNSIEIAVNKQRLKKNRKTLISATQRTSENIDGTKNLDGILLENMYIWYEHSNGHNKNLKWELKRFIFGVNQKRSSCKRIPICKAQKNNNQSFPYSSIKTIVSFDEKPLPKVFPLL